MSYVILLGSISVYLQVKEALIRQDNFEVGAVLPHVLILYTQVELSVLTVVGQFVSKKKKVLTSSRKKLNIEE